MAIVKIKGDKSRYSVLNTDCIGKACLQLGHYQTRGATLSGSRNTGDSSPCCMTRAYHGCLDDKYNPEIAQQRKLDGYKIS